MVVVGASVSVAVKVAINFSSLPASGRPKTFSCHQVHIDPVHCNSCLYTFFDVTQSGTTYLWGATFFL